MPTKTVSRLIARRAFSLLELLIVMVIMGVVAGLAVPKLKLSSYRVDAIAQQVRSVFQTSQHTSLVRQYDVIVSIDTVKSELRIAEDRNLDGTIESDEVRIWRPTGAPEGNLFSVPPKGLNGTVSSSLIGTFKTVDNLPSIIFHRDGSVSTAAEIYVSNSSRGVPSFRAVTLTRSTGRTELYRYSGTGPTGHWELAR